MSKGMGDDYRMNLRLPAQTVETIDRLRKKGVVKVPRNTWVAMAIAEKIERDDSAEKGQGADDA